MKTLIRTVGLVAILAAPTVLPTPAVAMDNWTPHLWQGRYRTIDEDNIVRRENRAFTEGYTTQRAYRRYALRRYYDVSDGRNFPGRVSSRWHPLTPWGW